MSSHLLPLKKAHPCTIGEALRPFVLAAQIRFWQLERPLEDFAPLLTELTQAHTGFTDFTPEQYTAHYAEIDLWMSHCTESDELDAFLGTDIYRSLAELAPALGLPASPSLISHAHTLLEMI